MKNQDLHLEVARLQEAIEQHLGIEGGVVFDYEVEGKGVRVNLITVNRRHRQSFLFHSELGVDKIDGLSKMLVYAKNYKSEGHSYTIQWRSPEMNEVQTSYFRARNMYEALDKLYYGRDMGSLMVFSVVLNPVA